MRPEQAEQVVPSRDAGQTGQPEEPEHLHQRTAGAASQWRLMWWKFTKHRVALVSLVLLAFVYLVVALCEFVSPSVPDQRYADYKNHPPQAVHFVDAAGNRSLTPFIYASKEQIDPDTLRVTFVEDVSHKIPLCLFCQGPAYRFWGLFPTDVHLVGLSDPSMPLLLAGSDSQGRDVATRILYGGRISLTFGVVGILLTMLLGIILGGLSGYFGGVVDSIIQRITDVLVSIPTIPLWMALSAALPRGWGTVQTYFGMIVVFSVVGWTGLARAVRGELLSLREEDFTVAARLAGASPFRIVWRHLLPSLASFLIVNATLSIPATILGETALSFLGLGMQPPAVSWGVLLQEAQSVTTLAYHPWLLWPAVAVVLAVLLYNFIGDGLRDAADPYAD